jgi:hypothetical protein
VRSRVDAPPAPSAVVKAEIGPGSLLQEELELSPFLGTRDLLRLSEAAPWLEPYRYQLEAVRIEVWCDVGTPAMLSVQRRLHTIRLEAFSAVSSLMRCFRGEHGTRPGLRLSRLILGRGTAVRRCGDLLESFRQALSMQQQGLAGRIEPPWQEASDQDMTELWDSLADGVCPALEELDITRLTFLGPTAPFHLRQGLVGCPELRRLRLKLFNVNEPEGAVPALSEALERGLFPKLESLDIEARNTRRLKTNELIGLALQAFPRPALRELRLWCQDSGQPLVDALRWEACPGLTRLDLCSFTMEDGDVVMLVEGLRMCPRLREVRLGVAPRALVHRRLADMMREGGLPCLEELHVLGAVAEDDGVVAFAEALEARAGPKLRRLVLEGKPSVDASSLTRLRAACEGFHWIGRYPLP